MVQIYMSIGEQYPLQYLRNRIQIIVEQVAKQ